MSATASVVSTFQVLEKVAELQPIGLSALARAVGLPKSTVQRCLITLDELKWARPTTTKPTRWMLTTRPFSVGVKAADPFHLLEPAAAVMNALQRETGETILLCVPDRDEMVLVDRVDTTQELRTLLPVGTRFPKHASAAGLANLAYLDAEEFNVFCDAGLKPETEWTITDPEELRACVDLTRRRGYAVNDQGLSIGVTAVGACITERGGHRPVGSIVVSAPTFRITPAKQEQFGKAAAVAARQISNALQPTSVAGS